MKQDLLNEVLSRIGRDYGFDTSKAKSGWLQGGKCPTCSKKELYTKADKPWVLRCGRLNNCGTEIFVKEEYPEIFEQWGNRYPQTPENPNAAADAYLQHARGFDLDKIKGLYSQEHYQDYELGIGSATVRFPIPGGHWERLIDEPGRFGKKKAHFNKGVAYQGKAWEPPMPRPDNEIWFVEGIFDSLSLMHHDIYAATPMSCNNYPYLYLQGVAEQCMQTEKKRPKLVFAYDDGKAGCEYMQRHVERAIAEGWEASAAYIRQEHGIKRDWNDLHLAGKLNEAAIKDARYRGALLTARSAADKAGIMFRHKAWDKFFFSFNHRLFWFEIDFKKLNEAKTAIRQMDGNESKTDQEIHDMAMEASRSVFEIANCNPLALYYQANELTEESWYYLRIDFPHSGASVKSAFTGAQLASATEFRKRLLAVAPGALYTGSPMHLDFWLKQQMYNIKRVQTVDFVGYSKDHGAWVFDDLAIKDGRVVPLNAEDYFDLGKISIKTLNKSVDLAINPDLKDYDPSWGKLVWSCFGAQGMVALAFWFGSFFAEQIRKTDCLESYPFLELSGEPNSGKSTLIEFLWKLCGRTGYEGFDPQKATIAARARNFAQVSNLPVVLIESDRGGDEAGPHKQKGFDWDELKTAFNGRSVRSTGVKNSGNDTREPPFRGAILISQNTKVVASDAFMQRVAQIWITCKPVTERSRQLFKALAGFPVNKCSQFVVMATKKEKAILEILLDRYPVYVQVLDANPKIKQQRIIHNHAQLMALTDALRLLVEFSDESHVQILDEIIRMAEQRQEAINDDPAIVQEFWEVVDYIEDRSDGPTLNHSNHPAQEWAINLNEFIAKADALRQQIPDLRELKKQLKASRSREFIASNHPVNSAIHRKTIKCWLFKNHVQRPRNAGD